MSKMNARDADIYFAALKLIEQLYKDGAIPEYIFKNMLNEAKAEIDISQFNIDLD